MTDGKKKAAATAPNTEERPMKGLTPYQGKWKCFGLFECSQCSHLWGSAHSWADIGQQCHECRVNVYPHKQWRLKKRENKTKKKKDKAHLTDLCEKCKTIQGDCRTLFKSDKPTAAAIPSKKK